MGWVIAPVWCSPECPGYDIHCIMCPYAQALGELLKCTFA